MPRSHFLPLTSYSASYWLSSLGVQRAREPQDVIRTTRDLKAQSKVDKCRDRIGGISVGLIEALPLLFYPITPPIVLKVLFSTPILLVATFLL